MRKQIRSFLKSLNLYTHLHVALHIIHPSVSKVSMPSFHHLLQVVHPPYDNTRHGGYLSKLMSSSQAKDEGSEVDFHSRGSDNEVSCRRSRYSHHNHDDGDSHELEEPEALSVNLDVDSAVDY